MRLIDADALIRKYKKIDITDYEPELVEILKSVITDLENEPTISTNTESVVRCKDCKYCWYNDDIEILECRHCNGLTEAIYGNDFCSYGERREE